MSGADWTVRVIDGAGVEVGQIAPVRLQAELRWNDVGTWLIDVDPTDLLANDLLQPGSGIIVYPPGSNVPLFAGPRTQVLITDATQQRFEVSGVTDEVLLERRLASPDPAGEPPWSFDERQKSGQAHAIMEEFVEENCGATAPVVARRSLVVDPQTLTTSTGVWSATGQPLLEVLKSIGNGATVGFRVRRVNGVPTFATYVPVDRSATVIFSFDLGTIEKAKFSDRAPNVTHAVVSGEQGPYDVVRPTVLVDDPSLAAVWGRIEQFVSHGESADTNELIFAGAAVFGGQQPLTTVRVEPVEGAALIEFPDAYGVGDRVTVRIGGTTIVDFIRQVTLTVEAGKAARAVPSLATIRTPSARFARALNDRLTRVETTRR